MWARRGGSAAAKLFRCNISRPPSGSAAAAAFPAHAAAGEQAGLQGSLSTLRGFSTSFWDVPGAGSSKQELYIEMHTIRSMLPNRSPFVPHFTPHGVMLMPNTSSSSLAAAAEAAAAAASGAGSVADTATADEDEVDEFEGMLADSVKRKRKLKMKRHKVKKRRKLTRHQQ